MSDLAVAIVAGAALLAVSVAIFGVLIARSLSTAFKALTDDRRWFQRQFLGVLEPRLIQHMQEIHAIDEDLLARGLANENEPVEFERY